MSNKYVAKQDPLTEFVKFVNHAPPKQFVLDHPLANGVKYIPIGQIEKMLDRIFKSWNVEVLREGQLLNSIYVTVRVNYLHPILNEWQHQDGVGAMTIQVEKGKDASDLKAIKSNAIMLALPAAKSFAIKDAVEHIGKSFGRDINRKDMIIFSPSTSVTQAQRRDMFTPMNTKITVAQEKELFEAAKDASGLGDEEQIKNWFEEICSMKITQVKKIEFDMIMDYVKDNATVSNREAF